MQPVTIEFETDNLGQTLHDAAEHLRGRNIPPDHLEELVALRGLAIVARSVDEARASLDLFHPLEGIDTRVMEFHQTGINKRQSLRALLARGA